MLLAIGYFKKKIKAKHQAWKDEQDALRYEREKREEDRRKQLAESVHPKNRVDYWK